MERPSRYRCFRVNRRLRQSVASCQASEGAVSGCWLNGGQGGRRVWSRPDATFTRSHMGGCRPKYPVGNLLGTWHLALGTPHPRKLGAERDEKNGHLLTLICCNRRPCLCACQIPPLTPPITTRRPVSAWCVAHHGRPSSTLKTPHAAISPTSIATTGTQTRTRPRTRPRNPSHNPRRRRRPLRCPDGFQHTAHPNSPHCQRRHDSV